MAYLTLTPQEESNCFMFIGMNKTQNNGGLISNTTSILDSSDSEVGDTCSFYSGPSDSTIFAFIGDDKSISNYTFDALTRISYNGEQTTLSNEASLIIKSSIVLNQSGLLALMSTEDSIITMPLLMEKNFNEEDIDIIIELLDELEKE